MSVELITMSHSPLLGINDPAPQIEVKLNEAFATLKEYAKDYDPDLVIVFTPDHFNGFFYNLMPPYCIGYSAESMGDYKTTAGPLNVPEEAASELAQYVISQGIDVAISREMLLDHGGAQPLEILFGELDAKPVIPIFINGVARPFVEMERVRKIGQAVGAWAKEYAAAHDKKILMIASGGLSHDPPLPQWATATDAQKDMLLHGHPDQESRDAREARVIAAGKENLGKEMIQDINPEWDKQFLADCAAADPTVFDKYTADQMDADAGHSSHEVRTWVAAFSALHTVNNGYSVNFEFYAPIPEFVAGFGMTIAK
ncbi:3-carboxyethylcatechol 2,3-dioxygenase [Corynebacterium lizhenjunii]|uniref:3-carboxyethylcatechol 2,3-dioxygenase n=1 Tax=Corynebacterium lizhenjunii TaxID=2709394 RepID=A0A7T0PAJ6_9CORY|nr:3-carboxyethylcatechol 2,3-dioxygenase [Corynebacterium lizhenjunii]QPK79126.1 3-carboxyethylcatechol 2,3-dioxygenase [Corynebacterium lizhenjunii]